MLIFTIYEEISDNFCHFLNFFSPKFQEPPVAFNILISRFFLSFFGFPQAQETRNVF